jgi:uncharacterized membrane protein
MTSLVKIVTCVVKVQLIESNLSVKNFTSIIISVGYTKEALEGFPLRGIRGIETVWWL